MQSSLTIMAKPAGPDCNLCCDYCFYLNKKALFPSAQCRMSDAVLQRFTQQYIEQAAGGPVSFVWQGGEPTLAGLGFFKRAVALQRELRRPGQRIENTLQTNGTLIDAEWAQFLQKEGFLVGLSLDGDEAVHNRFRRTCTGRGSFATALAGFTTLREYDVACNVLCTVNRASVDCPAALYDFFKGIGACYLQFVTLVGRGEWQISGEEWGDFLCRLFDHWQAAGDTGKMFLMNFEALLGHWVGRSSPDCIHDPQCGQTLILEHSGDLFCCDFSVTEESRLGNILHTPLEEILQSPKRDHFSRRKMAVTDPLCLNCEAESFCRGGCPADRQGSGGNRFCAGYQMIYAHTAGWMKRQCEILERQAMA